MVSQQSLSEEEKEPAEAFRASLSLATSTSRSSQQRVQALNSLHARLSSTPPVNPLGTIPLLDQLLPLTSDGSASVRQTLLKLLRALPVSGVRQHAERILMYIRAGLTHLSHEIRSDALTALEWLLEVAPDAALSCPGGWMKTLNSFGAMLGWSPSLQSPSSPAPAGATPSATGHGWTTTPKPATLGIGRLAVRSESERARQLQTLSRLLDAGLRPPKPKPLPTDSQQEYVEWLTHDPPNREVAFAHLNLYGPPRDENSEMYADRGARQRVFRSRWYEAVRVGTDAALKEGGAVGRAAGPLNVTLMQGLSDYEESVMDLVNLYEV